jgi:hypothetical protein
MLNNSFELKIRNSSEDLRQEIAEASTDEHPQLTQRLEYIQDGYKKFMSRRKYDPVVATTPAVPMKANAMAKRPANPCPLPGHSAHEYDDCIETKKVVMQTAQIAELVLKGLQKHIQGENRGRTLYPTSNANRSRSNSNRSRSNSNANRSRSNSRNKTNNNGNYRTRSNSRERGFSLMVTEDQDA